MNTSRYDNPARGFTLIEVLMAVLVLGIGLLGLASVLPVVLKQQWDAADQVRGELAMQSAVSFLKSEPSAAYFASGVGGASAIQPYPLDERFFSILAQPWIDPDTGDRWRNFVAAGQPTPPPYSVLPQIPQAIPYDGTWRALQLDGQGLNWTALGIDLRFNRGTSEFVGQRPVFIPLAARLYPDDASGARRPQYVWDLAIRRMSAGYTGARAPGAPNFVPQPQGFGKVQIAVFVRRLDGRIVIPRTQTLFANLTDRALNAPDRKNPVSTDATDNPTFDGRSDAGYVYSRPLTLSADFQPYQDPVTLQERRDVIQLGFDSLERYQRASQAGQILVDNLGNIYTVVGEPDPSLGVFGVRVSPPVPLGVAGAGGGGPGNTGAPTARLTQVIFTPQIPAAVRVIEVNP